MRNQLGEFYEALEVTKSLKDSSANNTAAYDQILQVYNSFNLLYDLPFQINLYEMEI